MMTRELRVVRKVMHDSSPALAGGAVSFGPFRLFPAQRLLLDR